jgi:hypothetical protein
VEESEIEIVTKDQNHITLTKWMSDGTGGIYGMIGHRNPEYSMQNWQAPEYFVHWRGILVDSIASIQKSEFSPGKTMLLVASGAVAGGVVVFGGIMGHALRMLFSF